MASQITHVVYGKKIFDRNPGLDWQKFVVGTCFPDIRYPSKIDRNITHKHGTSENKIPKKNSFTAGMYVHSLVDEKRENIIRGFGIYELVDKSIYTVIALKLVEDQLVWPKFKKLEKIADLFSNYYEEEFDFLPRGEVKKWHRHLQKYFAQGPNKQIWGELISLLGLAEEVTQGIFQQIDLIQKKPQAISIIKNTYQQI